MIVKLSDKVAELAAHWQDLNVLEPGTCVEIFLSMRRRKIAVARLKGINKPFKKKQKYHQMSSKDNQKYCNFFYETIIFMTYFDLLTHQKKTLLVQCAD